MSVVFILLYCNLLFHNCIRLCFDELGNKLIIIWLVSVLSNNWGRIHKRD